jgi:hypothetical protein
MKAAALTLRSQQQPRDMLAAVLSAVMRRSV